MLPARVLRIAFLLVCIASATPVHAQQTGAITGKVIDTGGGVLPGVTVEAKSDVLPTPRVTITGGDGEYRLPALPPGTYTLKFELAGMQPITRQAMVQLGADTVADATLKDAFSEMLLHDAGWVAVLDHDDRFLGMLTPTGLLEASRRSLENGA